MRDREAADLVRRSNQIREALTNLTIAMARTEATSLDRWPAHASDCDLLGLQLRELAADIRAVEGSAL